MSPYLRYKVDITLISETKVDENFPISQFSIEDYTKPIRLDRNCYGGGLIFYARDDIPCKETKSYRLPKCIEGIFVAVTLRKTKWLILGGYNPHKNNISYFLNHISKEIDKLLVTFYEHILILGDFDSPVSEMEMKTFCELYDLQNVIKEPTCHKNVNYTSSIDAN